MKNHALRNLSALLILSFLLPLAACAKKRNPNIPEKSAVVSSDPLLYSELEEKNITRQDMISAWGEPDGNPANQKVSPNYSFWKYEEHFIQVWYNEKDIVQSIFCSVTMKCVIILMDDTTLYAVPVRDSGIDYVNPFILSSTWLPSEVLEKAEPGVILEIEFEGRFMETYPAQIAPPYRVTYVGMVEESEMHRLQEEADALREFVWYREEE